MSQLVAHIKSFFFQFFLRRLGFFTEDAYRNLPGVGHSMKVTGISAGIGLYHLPRWMLDFAMVYESMDQGLGSNDTYYDLRTFAGQQYYRVKLDYGSSGSDFSQSSFRMLSGGAFEIATNSCSDIRGSLGPIATRAPTKNTPTAAPSALTLSTNNSPMIMAAAPTMTLMSSEPASVFSDMKF